MGINTQLAEAQKAAAAKETGCERGKWMRGNAREKHLSREEETGAEESCDKRPTA